MLFKKERAPIGALEVLLPCILRKLWPTHHPTISGTWGFTAKLHLQSFKPHREEIYESKILQLNQVTTPTPSPFPPCKPLNGSLLIPLAPWTSFTLSHANPIVCYCFRAQTKRTVFFIWSIPEVMNTDSTSTFSPLQMDFVIDRILY